MTLWQTLRVALRALFRNKLRSFLTTLGIVIGVAAVIAMVALGEGAKSRVQATFTSMGTNLVIILPGSSGISGSRGGFGTMPTLTWADLDAIKKEVPAARSVAPVLSSSAPVLSEQQNWTTRVYGTTPAFLDIRSWKIDRGSLFTDSDVETGNKVVLLGATVVEKLFGADVDAVGESIRIMNVPFQVVGILAKKGQSPVGQDYDDVAIVPVSTYRARLVSGLGNYISGSIYVSATSQEELPRVERGVTELLRDRHHLAQGTDDDFSIRNMSEIANASQEGAETLTTLLLAVAAVSLAVGGIGIMNIMLVSVTERTREIGLRMAVGATPMQILAQFLAESLSLSLLGGLIGIGAGLGVAAWLVAKYSWPMLIRPDIIIISVVFSALVGVAFGLYPAIKASRLDPIDALRYE